LKTNFNPKGLAHFFAKLKDSANAKEFLQTHPLSINRVADSWQRVDKKPSGGYQNSMQYLSAQLRTYYQIHQHTVWHQNEKLNQYGQAYEAFSQQDYIKAQQLLTALLKQDTSNSSLILMGRVQSRLGNLSSAIA
jgi:predicted Zn-dependent protease